jgi:hypothetical protein
MPEVIESGARWRIGDGGGGERKAITGLILGLPLVTGPPGLPVFLLEVSLIMYLLALDLKHILVDLVYSYLSLL